MDIELEIKDDVYFFKLSIIFMWRLRRNLFLKGLGMCDILIICVSFFLIKGEEIFFVRILNFVFQLFSNILDFYYN